MRISEMRVIGVIVMWAMLAALVFCAALWPLARHADGRGRPGLLHSALSRLRRLTLSTLLALSAVFTISVAHSGKNTNGVQNVGGQFLLQFTPPSSPTVTPQDLSNGWRVVEEAVVEAFAQPSANAVTNELWFRRGAHDDAFRIPADGWAYSSATGVTVLSRGELRTNIHAHDFPRAFEQDLSLVPLVNWPLLPEGRRESFFWHDATPSNTLLTTWWNAALGRDVTTPVNFQAELFPNGMFTYRYEDRTVRHARVWSFDWDDDGLENSVDPDPLTAGPDAHGTNAEWYNTVCSNVFEVVDGGTGTTGILPVGGGHGVPALPWREGVRESGAENDVTVSGSLVPNGQGETIQSDTQLTVARILLTPEVDPPKETTSGRHTYGVCEFVRRFQFPSTPVVTWNPVGGGSNAVSETRCPCYRFPLNACTNPLRVELGDAFYVPRLSCIEPSGIVAREVGLCTYGLPAGKAGGIGLLQAFYVTPLTVSFSEIAVEEVPCNDGSAEGYFQYALPSNAWAHTSAAGAGEWHDVYPGNRMGDPNFRDEAAFAVEMLPMTPDGTLTNDYTFGWTWGTMTWGVPFGWNAKGTTNGIAPVGMFEGTTQTFHIDPWGNTSVRKFANQATRRLDDSRYLNGVRISNNEVRSP